MATHDKSSSSNQAVQTDEKSTSVSDYLQAPRKKRKTYVIIALEEGFDKQLAKDMQRFVATNFGQLSMSMPVNTKELARQFGRKIASLIISDQFDDREGVINLVKTLKQKRHQDAIPVLFLTKNPAELIDMYHKNLLAFHEIDEYVEYDAVGAKHIFSRIKSSVENKNSRRSRRYQIDYAAKLFRLHDGMNLAVRIIDMSIHGILIQSDDHTLFREGEQVLITIPTNKFLSVETGDFFRVSGRTRRIYISGTKAAISFEHVSEHQLHKLTEFLSSYVVRGVEAATSGLKIRKKMESA